LSWRYLRKIAYQTILWLDIRDKLRSMQLSSLVQFDFGASDLTVQNHWRGFTEWAIAMR